MFLFYLVGSLISIKSHIALNGTACKKVVFLGVLLVLGFILLFFIYFFGLDIFRSAFCFCIYGQ